MTDAPHILHAGGLVFGYRPDRRVLDGVSLTAAAGELLCVLGPNGSGKTTLLRCLLGQLTPQGGSIRLDDRLIEKHTLRALARLMAYVPQVPSSAFAVTVQEIVLTGRYAHTGVMGLAAERDLAVARAAMDMTHTRDFESRTLDELSGGEAQCVMIARAVAQQPQVLLLDEPTSHLDIRNQLLIYRMLQRLAHAWRMAVVCVSHDVNLAARFADRLLLMREGVVVADGPPADVVRADVLGQTYGVEIDLIEAADLPAPMVWAR